MPIFAEGPAENPEFTHHGDVLEWLAHPEEQGRRASHAIPGEDGLWVLDPIDVPDLDDHLGDVADEANASGVAGVAVLANFHARDAGAIAARHDVPVHIPDAFDRVPDRIDDEAEIVRFESGLGDSGFDVRPRKPTPGWREVHLRRGGDRYVPDLLGTAPIYTVGEERLGIYLLRRPFPPRKTLGDADPERIFVGHGRAVTDDAAVALEDALDGARWRFPRALVEQAPGQLRALLQASR